jgi:hypothetical protein
MQAARHAPTVPSASVLLQELCQHGENESKRERAHNEMHDQPLLASESSRTPLRLFAGQPRNSSTDDGRSVAALGDFDSGNC